MFHLTEKNRERPHKPQPQSDWVCNFQARTQRTIRKMKENFWHFLHIVSRTFGPQEQQEQTRHGTDVTAAPFTARQHEQTWHQRQTLQKNCRFSMVALRTGDRILYSQEIKPRHPAYQTLHRQRHWSQFYLNRFHDLKQHSNQIEDFMRQHSS